MSFSDPLSVTYNSIAKSLPRVAVLGGGSVYRTADGEFSVVIERPQSSDPGGHNSVSLTMNRGVPDPAPLEGDLSRAVINSFGVVLGWDVTQTEASVDIPRLRTAVLALVDSTFQSRLINGEF